MADNLYNQSFIDFGGGINIDASPLNQPRGTRRFTLNTVEKSTDGQFNLANEPANYPRGIFSPGFYPIGSRYIGDDTSFIILKNPTTGEDELGLIDGNDEYSILVNTKILSLSINHQCDIRYRVRRGREKVVYWVDGLNNARSFNITTPYNYYSDKYKTYLTNTPTDSTGEFYGGEKWEASAFDLIKTYKRIPEFKDVAILEYGSIVPGSYNFSVQYVDEDLNPTNWITTSNTINIFNDSLDSTYERIRGSRNIETTSQSFPRANKTIKLTFGNLDSDFPYYRVAIIRAANNDGEVDKVFLSDLQSTGDATFLYSGNDAALSEGKMGDIIIDKEVILSPQHIEQLENRLLLANTKTKNIDWCEFQAAASKITSNLITKDVILNYAFDPANVKNAKSTFQFHGYMPGEVYSFAIAYIFKDGYISPCFHIPGKSSSNTTSLMKYHELDTDYLEIHTCTQKDYWGLDSNGETLTGKPIRHHRFPFRHEVGEPLIDPNTSTSTTVKIYRYRLTAKVNLKAAVPPALPPTYPTLPDGITTIAIGYEFEYKVLTSPNTATTPGTLVDTDVSEHKDITIYDDTVPLDPAFASPNYAQLTADCELQDYIDRFDIVYTYITYEANTVTNIDRSKIFGIEFSNITNPLPDEIVGVYIVRNERTDDDSMVVDTALLGPTTQNSQYKSFGTILPKQYYHVNNCGLKPADSGKTVVYNDDTAWMFNPVYQYFQRKADPTSMVVEGTYNEISHQMPTISNVENRACNKHGTKGVYIDDVQAGTTYNPEVNKKKDKDDDGFDLVIGYRNYNMKFAINTNNAIKVPDRDRIIYLTAANYQVYKDTSYYNVSVDNKIGMYITGDNKLAPNTFSSDGGKTNRILYGALTRDIRVSYANFMNRRYFKEHNNPIYFNASNAPVDKVGIFNGDVEISAFNFVSSIYWDFKAMTAEKKSNTWKIIVGAVIIVAAVVLSIPSVGASLGLAAVAVGALAPLAISIGVSLITSGIKFEQMKAMIDNDYDKGLRDAITDGGVYECLGVDKEEGGGPTDDTIRWFSDRVSNIYMESRVPFGLRSGLTGGVTDFTDAPISYSEPMFRSYLTEKLTVLDREQGSGRLYKGYAGAEVYDMNLDYMRMNKQKVFIHLPIEYDCCTDSNSIFPKRVWHSQQSFQEEKVDNYKIFLPNNYVDIEGVHGEITGLYRLGNNLYLQTEEALWQLPQNQQERITNEIVSFIGTGSLFSILPRKVVDDDLGSIGTKHKWANLKTKLGMFSISESENCIYRHTDKVEEISLNGIDTFCRENLRSFLSSQLYRAYGVHLPYTNNPSNPYSTGYHSTYDRDFNRIIFTKRDYLILPNQIQSLLIDPPPTANMGFVYYTETGLFYLNQSSLPLTNTDYFEDKSWTLSYSLNTGKWVSWHSYMPLHYINIKGRMLAFNEGSDSIWRFNAIDKFQTYFNKQYPHIIEGVLKAEKSASDQIFYDVTIQTKASIYQPTSQQFLDKRYITFNKVTIYTSRQCSGEQILVVKETKPNRENWYDQQTIRILGEMIASREGRDWHINGFRDYVDDYDNTLFSSDWEDTKTNYYIDKVVNPLSVNVAKNWQSIEKFKDKYIIFRLKFDNFDNVNLITNYLLGTEKVFE